MEKNKKGIIKEYSEYLIIIAVVIIFRTFLYTPIIVQQQSMTPTLNPNDIMMLNKIGFKLNGVNRFDIVVIKVDDERLIKRVIGLPGEYIEYKDNKLFVDGSIIEEKFLKASTNDFILEVIGYEKIPEDKYFVVGDNRGNSTDSRIIGLIDKKDVIGKTNFILFPLKKFGTVNK